MRVIAGMLKGRPIKSVPGKETRPTSDKIKEATFHKMGPFFHGGKALDLFAGSGSLGIEAISRGFDQVIFVDQSRQAIQTIHKNINQLNIQEQSSIYRNDAFRALKKLHNQQEQFDLVLLDPPYEKINYQLIIDQIMGSNLLNHHGYIYIEHGSDKAISLDLGTFSLQFAKKYNETTSVTIYQKK
jgi:16S rRNA (guanine966-N2)-methyltransferase